MSHPSHKTRFSDSSLYDEVCTLCGVTDYNGMAKLDAPCKNAPAATTYGQLVSNGQSSQVDCMEKCRD
jgi:hypothetical protein